MRVIAALFGPYAPDALTAHVAVFSRDFKRFEPLTKLATSSIAILEGQQESRLSSISVAQTHPPNPATTSFTPVRHSADWIVASPNLLFRRAINGSKCYRVLHFVVFWDIDDNSRR